MPTEESYNGQIVRKNEQYGNYPLCPTCLDPRRSWSSTLSNRILGFIFRYAKYPWGKCIRMRIPGPVGNSVVSVTGRAFGYGRADVPFAFFALHPRRAFHVEARMTRNGHHVAVRKLRAFRHVHRRRRRRRCRSGVETVGRVRDHAGLYKRTAEPNKETLR